MRCRLRIAQLLLAASFAFAGEVIVAAFDSPVTYTPPVGANSWGRVAANGAMGSGGAFLIGQTEKGVIDIQPTTAFVAFEFWGWQRSDGGLYEIYFDGTRRGEIDVYGPGTDGSEAPLRLYRLDGLGNTAHTVQIRNLNDSRTRRGFGQMNFDHAVLTTLDVQTPSSSASQSSGSPSPSTTGQPGDDQSGGSLGAGPIAGIAVGVAALTFGIAILVFWLLRRNRKQHSGLPPIPRSDIDPGEPQPAPSTFYAGSSSGRTQYSSHLPYNPYSTDVNAVTPVTGFYGPTGQSHTSGYPLPVAESAAPSTVSSSQPLMRETMHQAPGVGPVAASTYPNEKQRQLFTPSTQAPMDSPANLNNGSSGGGLSPVSEGGTMLPPPPSYEEPSGRRKS